MNLFGQIALYAEIDGPCKDLYRWLTRLNIMFTITHRKFFINETQWKYVTEISILCINTRKRSLTNYEEYSWVVSEVTNVPQKAKIYTKVQDLNSMTEG